MKLVTGAIGVEAVSNTPTGLRVYVNAKFAAAHSGAPGAPRIGLKKALKVPEGWELHLSPHTNVLLKPAKTTTTAEEWMLTRLWNGAAKMPPGLPIGGKTPILDLRTAPDGGYIIVIPAQLNPSGKIGAIRRGKERRGEIAPSAPPAPPPPPCGIAELQAAIKVVNACIESMGDDLVISMQDGRLKAMIEIG